MIVSNISKEKVIGKRIQVADTFFTRLKGLLGQKHLADDGGLIIRPCQIVHTLGMNIAIDVIFIDCQGMVVGLEKELRPNRCSKFYRQATQVLEVRAGKILEMGIEIGDRILFEH